jgi:DNA-binding response OmpR family regulator
LGSLFILAGKLRYKRVKEIKMNRQTTARKQEKEVKEMKPVLIVEDETIMRESLRDWLKEEGYEVDTAESGEEALQKIGEKEFGVAVLDLRLPGKDGLEVLREATAQNPKFKGVIITAYPSVETAVEAMKIGAVSYIVKPFAPDALEKAIEEVLGPVQAEVKPKEGKVEEATAEIPVVEEAEVEEAIAITEEEIPAHLEQGQTYCKAGRYKEALREFQSILHIAPGHIETRVWVRKAKEELAKPKVEVLEGEGAVEEAVKVNECLWSKMGVVSYRICTRNYDCLTCEFDQTMQDKIAAGEASELDEALERLKELPGPQRVCRYALKGDVSYRLCTRLFQCATCEFGQFMQDALERKLAKLSARREALHKKEASAKDQVS